MAKEPELRSFYVPHKRYYSDVDPVTGELVDKVSMTKQEFIKDCDINNIIKQFSQTGMLNHVRANQAMGMYADLPDNLDFQNSMNLVRQAEDAFMTLPSKIREQFGQDPARFLAFVEDPANGDELIKLGLRERPTPSPEPDTPAAPVAPAVPKEPPGGS